MKLDAFLQKITYASPSIIQWLFFAILVLSGVLIARSLFSKKSSASSESPNNSTAIDSGLMPAALAASPELQGVLQKILEQTQKLEKVSVSPMSPQAAAQASVEVQELKKQLEVREQEIAKLKDGGEKSATGAASDIDKRIKELEARLAEYEILEDDIADLSLYKEENQRLRQELEKVKGGEALAINDKVEAPAQGAPPMASESDLDADASVAAMLDQVDASANEASPLDALAAELETVAEIKIPDTGDPMADFESTVKLEKQIQSGESAPEVRAPEVPEKPVAPVEVAKAVEVASTPKAAPAAPEAAPASQSEADDLFAEFASEAQEPVAQEPEAQAGEGADGSFSAELQAGPLDTNKMMEEMAALISVEASEENALEGSIDTEKMAEEASGLTKG